MEKINIYIASLFQVYITEKALNIPESWLSELIQKRDKILVNNIYEQLKSKKRNLNLDDIIHHYMNVFSDEVKKEYGVFYTPGSIVDIMDDYALKNVSCENAPLVIDPAVGGGIFIYSIALKMSNFFEKDITEIIEENIFGIDILPENILMTKCILAITALEAGGRLPKKFNLLECDSFSVSEKLLVDRFGVSKFDLVITNPPYVRSKFINDEVKQNLAKFKKTVFGVPDLYIPFFELGFNFLKDKGIGAFITPNSYFRSLNGKKLRKFLQSNTSSIRLVNFDAEQIFDDVQHYSAITFFTKEIESTNTSFFYYNYKSQFENIKEENWQEFIPNEIWNTLTPTDKNIINKVESSFVTSLGNLKFQNGVATQRNNIYSFNYVKEDAEYYYFFKKSISYRVEKQITRPFVLPNTTTRDETLRIIFPYYYDKNIGDIKVITPEEMEKRFPESLSYLNDYQEELSLRKSDKKMKYWYLYGRGQGLSQYGKRLYLPYMASRVKTSISKEDDEVFAAGYAIFDESELYLKKIAKIIESNLFTYYISKVSKPYSGGYYSTAKNMIQNFSVPTEEELKNIALLELTNEVILDLYSLSLRERQYINLI
ncbi:hypothetical protein CI088_02075 [Enterococcus plantarum]|uniref:site-specific DNA-methyltransferase (adenine-specific) n=1 Tax=Enterococcus plantarum TaxID=1077675 RepID=A0A2W3ZI33_9ENTE|nr:N-6 DNA methylase [Enterococcus plantarum]PZL76950.1 hypothetical protein CI088_02075 [Enterococcus plantarum]